MKSSEQNFKNDHYHGIWIEWDDQGNQIGEGFFRNGNGKFIRWYPNGSKSMEKSFQRSKEHGNCTHWYENGLKSSEVNYKNGEYHGWKIDYDKKGNVSEKSLWKNNKLIKRIK